jgi:integrase
LLMLTGVRRDEAASSRWEEFSLVGEKPFWLLPGERVKNGRGHILPLAPEAVDILAKLDRVGVAGFVFTTTGETPVSGFAKMKSRLDALMLAIAREECSERGGDPNDVEIKPWRLHDLRRTVATGMADIGIGPHIVEAVLNHVSGAKASVAGVYNRAAYESEKRIALLAWASRIKRLETDGYQVAPITTPLEVQS